MKKIVSDDHELIVRRVADQKEAADLELASIAARFERLEANAEQEVIIIIVIVIITIIVSIFIIYSPVARSAASYSEGGVCF